MALTVCIEPGCPTITDKRRCPSHTRHADRARGSRQARGYDNQHDKLRASYQRRMNAGEIFTCASVRCLNPGHTVDPNRWHLGHTADRTGWTGPEVPECNLSDAGKASHGISPDG